MTPNLDLGYTKLLLKEAEEAGCSVAQTAYILATVYWETNGTMQPVRESYYLGSKAEAARKKLRYYPAYGRGFVQITWHDNYDRAGRKLGLDLVSDYDKVMEPNIAAKIAVRGSMEGWFTGRKLPDYLNDRSHDFYAARRVINKLDCAQEIADIAEKYEAALTPKEAKDYPLVRFGDRGAHVSFVQQRLVDLGYLSTRTFGFFGNLTDSAVRRLQRDRGLVVDGIVGPATLSVLMEE